ncbi:MAG: hypothetical protein JO057_31335 [Chloroflexi bacterium]|nr:hypothetical protein [Chloroflexota bacterium]
MSAAAPRDATAFEVREALSERGCAVCRLALRSVGRLLRSVAYEQVNDISLRSALRTRGGFCNAHAHAWLREAHSVLGTALIYKDVLEAALRELEAPTSPNASRGGLLRALLGSGGSASSGSATGGSAAGGSATRGSAAGGSAAGGPRFGGWRLGRSAFSGSSDDGPPCPACRAQDEAEARYVEALLALLAADPAVGVAFDASDGLCRRHTQAALRSGHAAAAHIVRRTREALATLLEELDEVIRKEDYRFRHEPRTDGERTAPARAINWAAGADGLTS